MPTTCCRPPRSSSTWTCTPATATPTCCSTSRRSRRWARPSPTRRSSASWPRAWASTSPASPTATRRWRAAPSAERGRLRRAARARAGSSCRCPRRRSPRAASPRPTASAHGRRAGPGRARPRAQLRERAVARPSWPQRYPLAMISPPARNFLNSSFVNVKSLRDIEGEPLLEIHADDAARARHRRRRDGARLQRPRQLPLQGRASARARGPAWSTAWASGGASSALDGTNVNELTHQRLTDIGRAPTFYDCLVEVARRPERGARRALADGGPARLVGAGCCWRRPRCAWAAAAARWATTRSRSAATSTCCARARPVRRLAGRPGARRPTLRERLALSAAHARLRGQRAEAARQRQLPPLCRPAAPGRGVERGGRARAVAARSRPGASR